MLPPARSLEPKPECGWAPGDKLSKSAAKFTCGRRSGGKLTPNTMRPAHAGSISPSDVWKQAREGDLRGGLDAARRALNQLGSHTGPTTFVDLHLAIAFCSMRGGDYAEATRVLNVAATAAGSPDADRGLVLESRPGAPSSPTSRADTRLPRRLSIVLSIVWRK